MKLKKGFTIIELLIVMAVIAILVGIAIPSFRAMQTEAWRTKAEGDVRVIKIALESYYKNQGNGSFPSDADQLTWQNALTGTTGPRVLEAKLNDPFAASGISYRYDLSPTGSYYVVFSIGQGGSATIAGISDTGSLEGTVGDDVYTSNGY